VAAEGREVTEAIWHDMPQFGGYLSHMLVEDMDDPGHLLVISEWESREAADRVREEYAGHENARRADSLVSEPRRRIVAQAVGR
jgi:heme-degrading monooxygenase HmoA